MQQPPLDPSQPSVLNQLQQLHPECPDALPTLPADAPEIAIDGVSPAGRKKLRRLFAKLNNGSSAGPSGMNGAHLAVLAADDECLIGLARLLQDICNGNTGDTLREYLLSSMLIPLPKANGKVRPIAIGEQLKRAADAYMNTQILQQARSLCQPHQFGLGTPGGCERVVHGVNAMLANTNNVAFLLDIVNAFNAKSRAKILREIYANPSLAKCWRLVNWTYGSESALRLSNGHVIRSLNGVKQGETLGSLMFAVSMRRIYEEAASLHKDTVRLFAVMDDATFVGPADHVLDCVIRLCELLRQENLHVNYSKCCLLSHPSNPLPKRVTDWLSEHKVPLTTDATMLLGAPIGWDATKIKALLQTVVDDCQTLFDRLLHPALTRQESVLVLRLCLVPTFGYIMRVAMPQLLAESARQFDTKVLETAVKKLQLPKLTEQQTKQLRLKLRNGGLGLPSTTDTSPLAFLSAFLSAHDLLAEKQIAGTTGFPRSRYHDAIAHAVGRTRSLVGDQPASRWIPPQPELKDNMPTIINWAKARASAVVHMPRKLQHAFTHAADRNRLAQLLRNSNKHDRSRLRAVSADLASAWLTAIPSSRKTQLSNPDMSIACRFRLGISAYDDRPYSCVCGKNNGKAGVDSTHALACQKVRKTEVNMRHNVFRNEFTAAANKCGCTALNEPQALNSQQRADTHIILPDGDVVWVDTSVVHPTAPTWQKRGSAERTLAAANTRALEKHTRYDALAAEQGASFVAAIAETYGGLNPECKALAKRITRFAANNDGCPLTAKEAYSELISSIAVGIQRGNARIFQRMRMINKAAGLAVADLARAPASVSNEADFRPANPMHTRSAARSGVPAQPDGFGIVDESSVPLPEQLPAPRANVNADDLVSFGQPDELVALEEQEAQELGFDSVAGAASEALELEEYMLDELADDFDDDGFALPAQQYAHDAMTVAVDGAAHGWGSIAEPIVIDD
ncbi:MAG: reverse transcriptase domain-containing protein [Sulfobacillus sp.]